MSSGERQISRFKMFYSSIFRFYFNIWPLYMVVFVIVSLMCIYCEDWSLFWWHETPTFYCFCPSVSSKFPSLKKKYNTVIRSQPTSGAAWRQAYVFDPCGTYMSFINTCLLEERCTVAASWWGKPGAGSACVTGRLLFPFHRWLISLWRLGTAPAECMRLFLRSLLLAALWLPD